MENNYEYECSLLNPKYQLQTEYNTYDYLIKNCNRIIQLPTIAKLTTDNKSLINDFPIDFDMFGLEPYLEYVIKVEDAEGTYLYIFVHYKMEKTYLLPIVIGFKSDVSCSPLNFTDNWRIREITNNGKEDFDSLIKLMSFKQTFLDTNIYNHYISYDNAEKEFGIPAIMMVIKNTGIYGTSLVLANPSSNSLLTTWKKQEYDSLYNKNTTTTFSSASLVIQIWLHTVCMWRKRCVNRKIRVVKSTGQSEYTSDIKSYISSKKNTIVDINKDIVLYVNENLTKREFRGYHMKETSRCGHFRHLANGNVIYIPPTIVHYKKIIPEELRCETNNKPLIYRNIEDFLKLKSYLEYDVMLMLKGKGIEYEREKMFAWMGKKRLDFYLPNYSIAIECQGVQHFYPYGSQDKDFENRKQRDVDKYNECELHDITLVYYTNPDIPIPKELSEKYTYVTNLDDLYDLIK